MDAGFICLIRMKEMWQVSADYQRNALEEPPTPLENGGVDTDGGRDKGEEERI